MLHEWNKIAQNRQFLKDNNTPKYRNGNWKGKKSSRNNLKLFELDNVVGLSQEKLKDFSISLIQSPRLQGLSHYVIKCDRLKHIHTTSFLDCVWND